MFMNQISSLKSLIFFPESLRNLKYIKFACFPEAKICLMNLTEFKCSSYISSEFFYQISKICHNIRSLTIDFEDVISVGLIELISSQNDLKSVTLRSRKKNNEMNKKKICSSHPMPLHPSQPLTTTSNI